MTPASLRGGGATQFYLTTENLVLLQQRARWQRLETLQIYVQEVSPSEYLTNLPSPVKQRLKDIAALFPFIFEVTNILLDQNKPPSTWYAVLPELCRQLGCKSS